MTTRGTTGAVTSGGGDFCPAVLAAARGDQAAFRYLYDRYARSVYNLVYRSVRSQQAAEDVCQEVWVKAYRELRRLAEPQAFPAWLYRIAARACVDAARKSSRAPIAAELPKERMLVADENPERSALRRERVRLTWEALAVLPARQHLALFLREIERRNYKEIAEMLETSEPAVETLLFRARRGFAKAFERLDATTHDRCQHAHRAMAALMDGEATPVQQTAVRAHVETCPPCSGDLTRMQRAAAAYSGLALLPVPALLGERIFTSLGVSGASAAPAGIAKFLALAGAKAKIGAVTLVATTATTAVAVANVAMPLGEEVRPNPPLDRGAEVSFGPEPWRGAVTEDEVIAPVGGPGQEAADVSIAQPGLVGETPVPESTELLEGLVFDITANINASASELAGAVEALLREPQPAVDGVLAVAPELTDGAVPQVDQPRTPETAPDLPGLP